MGNDNDILSPLVVGGVVTAPQVVIFHGEDADGWYAGYAAYKRYGPEGALYLKLRAGHPFLGLTGQPSPAEKEQGDALRALVAGKALAVLDLGLGADAIAGLAELVTHLLIIDHHAAFEHDYDRSGHDKVEIVYTPRHAAAWLAWSYFHPAGPVPRTIEYVEDRDLWTWQLPHSREVSAAIAARPWTFDDLGAAVHGFGLLLEEGRAILALVRKEVARTAAHAAPARLAGYDVPVVNATTFISEVGEALLGSPLAAGAPFVATYRVQPTGEWLWSLRSAPQANGAAAFDVGGLCRSLGGGGHVQAAGFKAPAADPFGNAAGRKKAAPQKPEAARAATMTERNP